MCGNTETMTEDSRQLFLTLNQDILIKKFHLKNDEKFLYMTFFGKEYKIDRRQGYISEGNTPMPADHDTMMGIYDMLSYSADKATLPELTGQWETLSNLGGIIGSGHTQQRLLSDEAIAPFVGKVEELKKACEALGGKEEKGGDVSYSIPVFDFFHVWFQFWDADDEFPAAAQFLWDKNSLSFLHYEILFYTTAYLEKILKEMINK